MTRYQNSILWLGLILIFLNLILNMSTVKSVIFKGQSATAKTVTV